MHTKANRILGTALILSMGAFAEEAKGPTVGFSGYLDADVVGTYDKDAKLFNFTNNHEADLITTITFSDKVSVGVGVTSYTPKAVPAGGTPVIDEEGGFTRWPAMYFDGIWGSYASDMGLTLTAGDFTVAEGAFSFYGYKRTLFAASIMKETYFRGLGLDFKGASLYAGVSDTSNTTASAYAAYTWSNDMISVNPFIYGTSNTDIKTGLTADVTLGDHSISASYGFIKNDNLSPSHTIRAEATLAFGPVTLYGSAFYAIMDESGIDVGEESFFYFEPDYTINDLFTVGSTFELHTYEKDAKDSKVFIYPTVYITPADGYQVIVWGGPSIAIDDENDMGFDMGTELVASF